MHCDKVENKLNTFCFEDVAVLVKRARDFIASKSRNLPKGALNFKVISIVHIYFLGDKPLGDREMLLKKKRASTTDLSNNGDDQNLPDDDMGKFF